MPCTHTVWPIAIKTDMPLSSHYQILDFSPTFQVNINAVSTLATVAIRNEMHHVISHCKTHLYSHNYDNYVLYAKVYLVKNSFLTYL